MHINCRHYCNFNSVIKLSKCSTYYQSFHLYAFHLYAYIIHLNDFQKLKFNNISINETIISEGNGLYIYTLYL